MHLIAHRRPLFARFAVLASLLAVVAVLASCGGDDDDDGGGGGGVSTASFCDEVKTIFTSQGGGGADAFQNAIDKLQKVEPPEDISAEWKTVMDAWDAQDASEVDLQETQKAGTKVQKFIRDECGLSEQN